MVPNNSRGTTSSSNITDKNIRIADIYVCENYFSYKNIFIADVCVLKLFCYYLEFVNEYNNRSYIKLFENSKYTSISLCTDDWSFTILELLKNSALLDFSQLNS